MKKAEFTEKQIACVLRQVEGGASVPGVCPQVGVSEATFYTWKKKSANLGGRRNNNPGRRRKGISNVRFRSGPAFYVIRTRNRAPNDSVEILKQRQTA